MTLPDIVTNFDIGTGQDLPGFLGQGRLTFGATILNVLFHGRNGKFPIPRGGDLHDILGNGFR